MNDYGQKQKIAKQKNIYSNKKHSVIYEEAH